MDMAPATPQSHQPLLLLYPVTYGLPLSMVRKQSLATMGMPFPWEFRRAEPEKGPLGMPVFRTFRVLHRVVRCLRAVLSKVLERCGGVMEVLRSAAYPAPAGKDRALGPLAERDGLGPTGGAREQGRYPAGQEWNYAMDLKVLDEEEVVWNEEEDEEEEVWDEEEALAPDVKTMEGDDAPGEEGELDLCDWLEWEPEEEESPSDLADPLDPAPEPVLRLAPCGRSAACQNSPTGLNSEGEHSESGWSDEDDDEDEEDDDDDDEWNESDDEEDDDEWDESDDDEEDDDDEWDESDGSSELDSELWDSFLCSGDPSNPLRLSPPAGKKGRVPESDELSSTGSFHSAEGENEGEQESKGEDEQDGPPQKAGKKVQFSEEVEVRPLVAWAFASRAARDGSCWLQMARDRDRFRRRVQTASDIISPFLLANHRARVWERFQLT